MKKIAVIIFFICILSHQSFGAITGISDSALSDGQSITITDTGDGFGSNALAIEALHDNIEAGEVGTAFAKSGWYADPDCNESTCGTTAPKYSNTMSHSGSKSIASIVRDNAGDCPDYYGIDHCMESGFSFHGTASVSSYVTYWVHFTDNTGAQGQWKLWRKSTSINYSDVYTTAMSSQWYQADGSQLQSYLATLYPAGSNPLTSYTTQLIPQDTWCRVEHIITPGDPGHIVYRIYQGDGVVKDFFDVDRSIDPAADYYVFQNYWGNHVDEQWSDIAVYTDDIFIQEGSQARVEIIDTPNWADRTHAEIQYPTVWTSGSISFTVNQGSFSSGSAYVVVVDESGTATSGYPVAFSTSGAVTWYLDSDGDGWPEGTTQQAESDPGASWYELSELLGTTPDCNDSNSAINPGVSELCGNLIDDNCNGQIDEGCGMTVITVSNSGTVRTIQTTGVVQVIH